jgi:chemotaxis protein methyltransferase CheR
MEFNEFLKEIAPLLGLQWRPFQRKGIKRKVERRITQIGLSNLEEYSLSVKRNSDERRLLSKLLTVTISRFFRDKEVFETLRQSVIPSLLKEEDRKELRIWSIGCASGEEPYSLALLWEDKFQQTWPQVCLSILATDVDERMLARAKEGRYKKSSLKEVPEEIVKFFFKREGEVYILDPNLRKGVAFERHDILTEEPFLEMDIIFCRNLAFTYFSKERQIEVLKKIALGLKKNGCLVIGKDECLPLTYPAPFVPVFPKEKVHRKFS